MTLQTTIEGFDAWGKRHAWTVTWTPQNTRMFQASSAPADNTVLWGTEEDPPVQTERNNTGGVRVFAPPRQVDGIVFQPQRIESGRPGEGEFILTEV